MKDIKLYLSIFLIASLSIFTSCDSDSVSSKKDVVVEQASNVNESELLLNFINKSGDLINTAQTPKTVWAYNVYDNLNKYLIIDIRSQGIYEDGHIDGAINVSTKNLLRYMETKANPGNYEKVVIVGYSGQSSGYYATLLNLLGYGNVYFLKYGMCAWSNKIEAQKWSDNVSNKYAANLETKNNPKGEKYAYPVISTKKTTGYSILKARAKKVADDGFGKVLIKVDKLMKEKENYYIINYWPVKNYNIGHIPGAIQYNPRKSLTTSVELNTLPTDKPIVVYCYVGHHSTAIVAFLRVLGYDAYSLAYGANSFMNEKMKQSIGHIYNASTDVNDYPLVIGENPTDKKIVKQAGNMSNAPKKAIKKKKKKKKQEEGGC